MNIPKKRFGSILVVVAIIIAGGYFALRDSGAPFRNEPLKIGFIGPLTGENAAIGEGIKNAISLSAKNKNTQVIYEDDQFSAKLGVTAYHKLRDADKVDAIINTTPATVDAITPLLKENPIPIIQIAEPEQSADDTIFQIMPSGAALYAELGRIAKVKYPSVAFVYQSGATFEKAKNAFKTAYEDSSRVFKEYRIADSKDYRTIVAKIKSDNIAAYTVIATPSVGSQFIKQLNEQGISSSLLCNADMEVTVSEYLKVLPEKVFAGCVSAMFADRMSGTFKADYKNAFGIDPGFATDYGFDAVALLADTHKPKIPEWVSAIKGLLFNGVSGNIQFDKVGVRVPEIETHIFKDGKFMKLGQ